MLRTSKKQHRRPIVNLLMIFRVVGWLLLIEGGFMLAPMLTAILCREDVWLSFVITVAATFAAGATLTFAIPRPRYDMGKRDGFLLTALVWVAFSLFGMLPFVMTPFDMPVTDAFFETMSGFTTTGATLLSDFEPLPKSVVLWRTLMEWIGGMGIIIFTLAVLPMLNYSGGVQMFNAEVTGITHDKLRPRVSETAKRLWGIYFMLTLILFLALWAGPLDFFESLCHSFSIMSTGGYVPDQMNPALWDSTYLELVAILFMFLGGMNFALIYSFLHGNLSALSRNDVFRYYLGIIGVMFLLFLADIVATGNATDLKSVTLYPLFMIVSMISSTGYVVGGFEHWGPFVGALTLMLMFFGACAGSTAGGAKIDRFVYLAKYIRNELYRGLHPNSVLGVRMNGKVVSPDLVNKVIAFLSLFVIVVVLGGTILCALGLPLYDSFFTSFSCMSNTGLMPGVTAGYGSTFEVVPAAGKWVLSLLMLTGRLEVFTVILLFTPNFWSR
ncbi:MAG: TrkH family potassium uptake protein [Clostridium sp.]|nr:TrkH family potassium uptake protein [Clostridium sp.]